MQKAFSSLNSWTTEQQWMQTTAAHHCDSLWKLSRWNTCLQRWSFSMTMSIPIELVLQHIWSSFVGNVLLIYYTDPTLHLVTSISPHHSSSTMKTLLASWWGKSWGVPVGANTKPLFLLHRNWTGGVPHRQYLNHSGDYVVKYRVCLLLLILSDVYVEVLNISTVNFWKNGTFEITALLPTTLETCHWCAAAKNGNSKLVVYKCYMY
jgi:hypothetical protein